MCFHPHSEVVDVFWDWRFLSNLTCSVLEVFCDWRPLSNLTCSVLEVFCDWRPLSNLMTCSGSVAGMAITRAVNNARRRIEKRMVEMNVV